MTAQWVICLQMTVGPVLVLWISGADIHRRIYPRIDTRFANSALQGLSTSFRRAAKRGWTADCRVCRAGQDMMQEAYDSHARAHVHVDKSGPKG